MRKFKKILQLLPIALVLSLPSCTWQDAGRITANAAVYTAMVASGSGGAFNLHADLAGQAAEDFADLAFNCTE